MLSESSSFLWFYPSNEDPSSSYPLVLSGAGRFFDFLAGLVAFLLSYSLEYSLNLEVRANADLSALFKSLIASSLNTFLNIWPNLQASETSVSEVREL